MKRRRLHWLWYGLGWILAICLVGVVLGATIFPLVGVFFDTGYESRELALNGIRILGFYFSIWAPGVALVLTVKREYEARRAEPPDAQT